MRRIWRLLAYARPYALYTVASLVTTAIFAAMAGLRVMLIKPIIDNVSEREGFAAPDPGLYAFRTPGG